eukprot:gene15199-20135_t
MGIQIDYMHASNRSLAEALGETAKPGVPLLVEQKCFHRRLYQWWDTPAHKAEWHAAQEGTGEQGTPLRDTTVRMASIPYVMTHDLTIEKTARRTSFDCTENDWK